MKIYDLAHEHRSIKGDIKGTYPYKCKLKKLINTVQKKYKNYTANHQEKKAALRG